MTIWQRIRNGDAVIEFDEERPIPEWDDLLKFESQQDEPEIPDDDPNPFRCDGVVEFWISDPKKKRDDFRDVTLKGDVRGVRPKNTAFYKRHHDKHWRSIETGKMTKTPQTRQAT